MTQISLFIFKVGVQTMAPPRTLRFDHVLEMHSTQNEAEAYFELAKRKLEQEGFEFETKRSPGASRYSSPETIDICFTGFKKADKDQLITFDKENGMYVRGEVTKHLDILCYGYNAGPKKLEKALSQGAMILNKEQLETLIETGEVPEDV
ncbi:hypothetical protein BZG82_04885 [Salinivibrio sp. PR5]|uniref:hypothetical protein n=1 Tax=unclassified Salinivibrio TaxID=2636825 RepID=UPI000984BEEB|nr:MULTISPECIES: hypothetical protein [unclassified Salinivibrio]OOF11349.1 hypothetical protein BZG82_04885 [Salinivibrio sp. PR5]OOF15694.1 hypothetical protein BZG84_12055 [Salinivibrio sp. PR932]OOF16347.1 hypothetical protein BZG83_01040 [Salinivibrio sp. PR919]